MALKVVNANTSNKKLKVGVNYGMQGSTYNPQQTAPSTVVQNPAPARFYQPATNVVQRTAPVQTVATAEQIAKQAQQRQAQVLAAQAERKRQLTQQFNLKVTTATDTNKKKLTVGAAKQNFGLKVKSNVNKYKIRIPEQSLYDRVYAEAYREAMAEFDKVSQGNEILGLASIWDKASFGSDRRANKARRWAEERVQQIMDRDFKTYEESITKYEQAKAAAQDEIIRAANTFTSQKQYDDFVAQKQAELDKQFDDLQSMAARYDGMTAALGEASQKPLTSKAARFASGAKKIVSDENPIWRYTLGSGTENIPSLVTAPSRVVNFVGNLNTKDRDLYQYGGGSVKRSDTGKNAWQSSFNQRNFNIRPVVDEEYDRSKAFSELRSGRTDGASLQQTQFAMRFKRASDSEKEEIAKQYWEERNRARRNMNSVQELAADPLFFLQAAKAAKAPAWLSKLSKTAKASAPSRFFETGLTKLRNNKVANWLNKEVETAGETFSKSKKAIQDLSRAEQERLLGKVQGISTKLKDVPGYDLSWYNDLKNLSGKDLERFQRMTGDGKLAFRDRAFMAGKNMQPARQHLEDLARRYTNFMEQLRLTDDVKNTRFGLGKKRIYSPRTVWTDDLAEYDFRLFKRGRQVQSGEDFLHGVVDRFFKSDIDDVIIANTKHNKKYQKQLNGVWDEYGKSFEKAKSELTEARSKYRRDSSGVTKWLRNKRNVREDVTFGRALFNTANNVRKAPTQLWKKSVLKYRPAWTVNNVAYNTQAGVLAGGAGSLVEQAKMLNPRYWRKAMDEGAVFRSNIGKEIGTKGRLNRFYSGVEDWSRVAAGRSAMKKFKLTEDQALKRVNKYLFDYTTKNWERPIKSVVPFWSFQKNLLKASATMPFDRPLAAVAYNRLDRHQQQQFDRDFDSVVPELEKLGYSQEEIEQMRQEQSKYYKGKLKIGDKYFNTPFNAFSEKQMQQFGINPWLSAAQEAADSEDSFGRKIKGGESSFIRRVLSKFPQFELGNQYKKKLDIEAGRLQPSEKYIGEPGSEGYGLGKEKQGYDESKPNYVASLDPRRKLNQNLLAYAGVPRTIEFDKPQFVKSKKLQKVTQAYFDTNWNDMEFDEREKAQGELFASYGMTADDFYKGILSKYDTDNTKKIKGMKEDARNQNQKLLDEYAKQPYGTRSAWAAEKMRELQEAGYFKDNSFLYSFVKGSKPGKDQGWLTPETIAKAKTGAEKRAMYQEAKRTGDWSKWRERYGVKSQKAIDYRKAKSTGDWTDYRNKYGVKNTPYVYDGRYFKSAESMEKFKRGEFWKKYGEADRDERRQLLADNPQYNERANWTQEQWDSWKDETKKKELAKAAGFKNFSTLLKFYRGANTAKANQFVRKQQFAKRGIAFRIS